MSADVMLREPPTRVREYAPPLVRRIEPPAPRFQPPGRALMTLEEYFAFAEATEYRVEYYDGEIFIMGAVKPPHSLAQANLIRLLGNSLAFPDYLVFSGGVLVRRRHKGRFIPDMCVVRGAMQIAENSDELVNPALVVEVLSPSTRRHDIDTKLPEYRDMPTMEHILIVEQDRPGVQHHSRVDGEWTQLEYSDMDDIVNLESMGASMSLAQIYRGVDFPQS